MVWPAKRGFAGVGLASLHCLKRHAGGALWTVILLRTPHTGTTNADRGLLRRRIARGRVLGAVFPARVCPIQSKRARNRGASGTHTAASCRLQLLSFPSERTSILWAMQPMMGIQIGRTKEILQLAPDKLPDDNDNCL